ncbi:hypothetical protein FA10DRAFT_266521 [Acaromyces ingoldii]|uniref:Uncharacterized protein n=1 Tax=Acaromyces ingoldii TaxID=215250 RepID=A0A316YL95_9BASI|nr:hypothetical protein FA10DRAFT_266521 [Acaromyces ingoldii]PWN89999.1 hypothetical protein FA10DRAFT_266521 [Acaromyces ingoldii]
MPLIPGFSTASSDRSSQPAKYRFYEAAKAACSEEDRVASRWNWAHLDFEEEPGMIWRWWIWKVPIIVFVNRSSSSSRPYDVRFWKIAWQMPKSEQIVSVIDGSRWRLITPWEGSLAPGGPLESVPLLLSQGFSVVYEILDPMPSWLLTLLSMGVGFVLIGFLHSGNSAQTPARRSAAPPSQRSGRPRQKKPSSST